MYFIVYSSVTCSILNAFETLMLIYLKLFSEFICIAMQAGALFMIFANLVNIPVLGIALYTICSLLFQYSANNNKTLNSKQF